MTKPDREQAEEAIRTLLRWIGEDVTREGLLETPKRVVKAYEELMSGYHVDPHDILNKTFREVENYDEMVVLKDIPFESLCEHHMLPFTGRVHIAYLPDRKVVGLSKLARLVDAYAKRLQIQEKMTAQIANALNDILHPKGVGVVVEAVHQCMTMRGVHKHGASMQTSHLSGHFKTDDKTRKEFLSLIASPFYRTQPA